MVIDPFVVESDLIECRLNFALYIEYGYCLLLKLLLDLKAYLLTDYRPAIRYEFNLGTDVTRAGASAAVTSAALAVTRRCIAVSLRLSFCFELSFFGKGYLICYFVDKKLCYFSELKINIFAVRRTYRYLV